jgi:hypothetical protein
MFQCRQAISGVVSSSFFRSNCRTTYAKVMLKGHLLWKNSRLTELHANWEELSLCFCVGTFCYRWFSELQQWVILGWRRWRARENIYEFRSDWKTIGGQRTTVAIGNRVQGQHHISGGYWHRHFTEQGLQQLSCEATYLPENQSGGLMVFNPPKILVVHVQVENFVRRKLL